MNAMNTRSTNRSRDRSWNGSFNKSSSILIHSFNPSQIIHLTNHKILDQITEVAITPVTMIRTTDRNTTETTAENRGYQQQPRHEQRNQNYQNRYDNNHDRNRFNNRRRPNKYQHHRNQHKAQIIFEFSDQNMMEMMQMVRGFINLIKANPATREQYKSNKLAICKYDNEVHELEINSNSLDQVQQFFNEDTDVVFNALVAADYIDEIDCTDCSYQKQA